MSERKPMKVETLRDRDLTGPATGFTADLCLDRDTGHFSATFQKRTYNAKTLDDLKTQLRAAFKAAAVFDWKPYIVITERERYTGFDNWHHYHRKDLHKAGFILGFTRLESCPSPGNPGKRLIRPFLTDGLLDSELAVEENALGPAWKSLDEYRKHRRESNLEDRKSGRDVDDIMVSHDDGDSFIDHTEERWATIMALKEALVTINDRLEAMLAPVNIEKSLAKAQDHFLKRGLLLLPGSKEEAAAKSQLAETAIPMSDEPTTWMGRRVKLTTMLVTKSGKEFPRGSVMTVESVRPDGRLNLTEAVARKGARGGKHRQLFGVTTSWVELLP